MSDDAKAELKRQGKRARDAETYRMNREACLIRFSARKRRRSIDVASKWDDSAEEWARLQELCADGVKQINTYEDARLKKLNDNKSKLISTYLGEDEDERDRVGITRMQHTLLIQAMSCAEYFKTLAERNREKAKRFRARAEALWRGGQEARNALRREDEHDANDDDDDDDEGGAAGDDSDDASATMADLLADADPTDPTRGLDVHVISDAVAPIFGKSGRTLRAWAREFTMNETFKLDMRGTAAPKHLLQDEDIKRKVKAFMSDLAATPGARGLSVEKFCRHVNTELLPALAEKDGYVELLDRTLKNEETGAYTICMTTARAWMKKCGASRQWHKQGAYTDVHELDSTKEFREEYLKTNAELQLRERTWVQMEAHVFEEYKAACTQVIKARGGVGDDYEWKPVEPGTPHAYKKGDKDWVELHVDDFQDTEGKFWEERTVSVRFEDPNLARPRSQRVVERDIARDRLWTCKFGHSGNDGTCKCHLPIYRLGHDEAVLKAWALPKGVWVIDDVMTLRKKSSGPGEMVSAVQDEHRGFGLKLSDDELMKVNEYRKLHQREALPESPGICFLKYGKNRDGYWDYEQFEKQAIAVLDVIEALHENHQVVLEVDWSQGHAKKLEGGLYVTDMNLK